MSLDVAIASYAAAAVVAYYAFLFILGRRAGRDPAPTTRWPLVVIVVPARNEAAVLARTVATTLACPYAGEIRLLLMNDASSDATADIAEGLAASDARVRAVHRSPELGGRGKSDVLNHGYTELRAMLQVEDTWLAGASSDDICVCVLDADGHLSETAISDAVGLLEDPCVGAVQIGVKIRNARDNLLARLQDMEFVGFSFMVQTARDRLGSVGLGGNGQFTRLRALDDLAPRPWRTEALTEDLDLGLRLQLAGWRLRFCSSAWVAQEGLTRLRPLLRQRTRWTQGHYQCWRYLRSLSRASEVRKVQRLDTAAYLVLILLVVLVSGTVAVQLLGLAGLLVATDSSMAWLGDGLAYRVTTFLLSWLPVALLIATYQRFAEVPLRVWEIPAYCVYFAAYVYLWAIATVRAWTRLLLRRGGWTKTPRVERLAATEAVA